MTGICGWINYLAPHPSLTETMTRMASCLTRIDRGHPASATSTDGPGALFTTERDARALYCGSMGLAAIFGEARISDPALAQQAREQGIAKTLLAGFQDRGPAILRILRGRFALALASNRIEQALVATDRLGVCPLYYSFDDGTLVFGSNADSVLTGRNRTPEIDLQQIFNYLYMHVVPSPGTVYKGLAKLEPGQYLWLNRRELRTDTYWNIQYTREQERLPVSKLKQEFLDLLRASVRQELNGKRVGAFLSGGTDSSTIAGLLTELAGEPALTYSIGFGAKGYDEMEYARIASRHFGTRHRTYYVTPEDVAAAIPKIAGIYSEPFGNASAVPAYYCARLAREDGVEKLLAGDGGDELFGGNARYAHQYLFSLYERIPRALREYLIEPGLFSIPAGNRIWPVRKLRGYIQHAKLPMPARLETYNELEWLGYNNVLDPSFLASVDTAAPMQLLSAIYHRAHATTMLNRMLALDLKITLADNDLPKVNKTCELAGLDVAYPLLHDDLVEFAARLPINLKLKGTRLRYFFKESLRDFLPREILTKSKHGFGLPYGLWLQTSPALREITFESLNGLKTRGIVRPDFIDRLIQTELSKQPEFYGVMAWVLVMLEQWLRHRVEATRPLR